MKIIKSTSKISMSGTTFISAIAPPLLSPTCIPIASLLLTQRLAGKTSVKPAARQLAPQRREVPENQPPTLRRTGAVAMRRVGADASQPGTNGNRSLSRQQAAGAAAVL